MSRAVLGYLQQSADKLIITTMCVPLLLGLLHGSSMESKDYWKDLEGLLLNEGFLEYKAHTSPGISQAWGRIMPESNNSQEQYGRSYSALSITPAGETRHLTKSPRDACDPGLQISSCLIARPA